MKKRYVFLDMLRALAIAEMIHGHSLDGLLAVSLRDTAFFVHWRYIRGYTAPMFLFASGFAFAIATLPHIDAYTRFSKELGRRMQRLFFIILLGYLMYLPYFSLRKTILSIGSPEWQSFLSVDILRCIGVSLLILQTWMFFRPRRFLTLSVFGVITILLPILSPYARESAFVLALPDLLRYYFVGSRFPLLHFSSYLFLGFLAGYLFKRGRRYWSGVSLGAVFVLVVVAQSLRLWGVLPSLQGFMMKGGVIVLLTVALEKLELVWRKLPSVVKFFGRESLLIYVVHVIIIYGSVLNKGLTLYWGATLSYGQVYRFIIWLMAAMLLLAYLWHKLKREHPQTALRLRQTMAWSFLILFVLRPY